jgi:ABC-2 type transport system permease protein
MDIVVLRALGRRDLRRYFTNPTGYVFITAFIFLSAAAAFWQPQFFRDNLAHLKQLNDVFPVLLLFFTAALTMGVWAEERKQGTDELLLTLPASDGQIVLGKYMAVLGVYTVSIVLSLCHAGVLVWLGSPDLGVLASNYLGYWLAGVALIAVGMLGSLLTSNVTMAFIFSSLLCAIPVLAPGAAAAFSPALGRGAAALGLVPPFEDFARGVVSLAGLVYFTSLAALFLYFNVLLLGRRHWPPRGDGVPMAAHHAARVASLVVALAAANVLVMRTEVRLDVTAERLHTVGGETRRLLDGLPADRPVLIQAFVSPVVPQEYVQQREQLLGMLREIQASAAPVDVRVEETERYSPAARHARERFGIAPRMVSDPSAVSGETQAVFLGVAFTAGAEEQVIPFLEHGLSAEYELTRALRVVAQVTRKRVGIVDTEARVSGGVDYESGRSRLSWAIVGELRKQYEVVQVAPWEPIQEPVDALLVVLPSTLLPRELDHVMDAVRRGVPTMIVVDPVPAMDMRLAPAASMAARVDPYATPGQAIVRRNTGDIQAAMASIGVTWAPARVVWDSYRPNAESEQLPREVVFVGAGSGNERAFNPDHPATAGLQQLMLMYPGSLAPVDGPGAGFEALVSTGRLSGTLSYFQLVQPTPAGPVLNLGAPHEPEGNVLALAAHIRSGTVNAVVVADLDFIADQAFALRAAGSPAAGNDNVTFFLNAIDVLAGDESFIELRKRRVRYRTLERVEARTRDFIERRGREEQQAAADAQAAIEAAEQGLERMVAEIESRADLDPQAKEIMVRNLEDSEGRKMAVLQANIEQARDAKIQASRETMEAEIRRIQGTIRGIAVLLPPLPVLVLGAAVFARRRRREREGAAASGRLRHPS